MSINDMSVLSALRTKMQWHEERQRVLSENVANSDTPKFKARDLVAPKFDKLGELAGGSTPLPLMRTAGVTITSTAEGGGSFDPDHKPVFAVTPVGTGVNLEEEMMKVSTNQMDFAAVTSLYSKSLHLLKTAIGKG
jgi:flagellar basal-body rod protein FlgB